MQVYGPPTSKVVAIKENNPQYWRLLLSRSQYNEQEINNTLSTISVINSQLQNLLSSAYDLTDGMGLIQGWDTDNHRELDKMLAELNYLVPSFSQNSHKNALPAKKWQKEVAKLDRAINKVSSFINENF